MPHLLRQQLRRVLLSGGRLAQVEVLQLPLGISHGGVGIQQRTAGALQLPVLQAASLHGGQLGHDLVIGLLVVLELNAGGDGDEPLLPVVGGRGVVAQGQLLPYIHKELGVAAAAKQGIAHQRGGVVVAAAGKAHTQLALSHVHGLLHPLHLGPSRMGRGRSDVPDPIPGQRGESCGQRLPYPLQGCAAAVEQLQPGGGKQLSVQGVELWHLQLLRTRLVAQAADAVGLPVAHLPQQSGVGILPLVIHLAADGVNQVGLLPLKISGHKAAPLGHGIAQQLSQQLRHRL